MRQKVHMEFLIEPGRVYAVDEQQQVIAEATYDFVRDCVVDVCHTYVSPELRGQGIAGQLMQAVADTLRKNGLKAVASCSYAETWFTRNRAACADILAET
ncbi:MAG TPA: GNAT family N-acetyltransferase [Clostridia bacterium]|nr:GNAT family N-acetyltransferase [Clostridia bacterium]